MNKTNPKDRETNSINTSTNFVSESFLYIDKSSCIFRANYLGTFFFLSRRSFLSEIIFHAHELCTTHIEHHIYKHLYNIVTAAFFCAFYFSLAQSFSLYFALLCYIFIYGFCSFSFCHVAFHSRDGNTLWAIIFIIIHTHTHQFLHRRNLNRE